MLVYLLDISLASFNIYFYECLYDSLHNVFMELWEMIKRNKKKKNEKLSSTNMNANKNKINSHKSLSELPIITSIWTIRELIDFIIFWIY